MGSDKSCGDRGNVTNQQKDVVAKSAPEGLQGRTHQVEQVPEKEGPQELSTRRHNHERQQSMDLSVHDFGRKQYHILEYRRLTLSRHEHQNLTNDQDQSEVGHSKPPKFSFQRV